MQWVNGWALWALLALSIPIIIHLFNFRRYKKIQFSNVKMLQEILQQTQQQSKLKHLLVLASRLLAMLFLILAFVQPFLSRNKNTTSGTKAVSIYIDNSMSMQVGDEINLLNLAKTKAKDILNAYEDQIQFQIITNDNTIQSNFFTRKQDALKAIDEVKLSYNIKKWTEANTAMDNAFGNAQLSNKVKYFISDAQKNTCDIQQIRDSISQVNIVLVDNKNTGNLSIDSAWLFAPIQIEGEAVKAFAKITNSADEAVKSKLDFMVNGRLRQSNTVELAANASIIDTVTFNSDGNEWNKYEFTLNDAPFTFDNRYFLSAKMNHKLKMLTINQASKSDDLIASFFRKEPSVEMLQTSVQQINYNDFDKVNLIIVNQLNSLSTGLAAAFERFLSNGGNIILLPSNDNVAMNTWLAKLNASQFKNVQTTARKAALLNVKHYWLRDVYKSTSTMNLPFFKKYYSISNASNPQEPLLSFSDKTNAISKVSIKKGNLIYFCSNFSRDNSEISSTSFLVPLVYNIASYNSFNNNYNFIFGKKAPIKLPQNGIGNIETARAKQGSDEFTIPIEKYADNYYVNSSKTMNKPGFYDIYLGNSAQKILQVALNMNTTESHLKFYSFSDLNQKSLSNFNVFEAKKLNVKQNIDIADNQNFWKIALILSLFFLLLETILIRFYK